MRALSRRKLLVTAAGVLLASPALPGGHTGAAPAKTKPLVLDDASRLNAVALARNVIVRGADDESLIAELRTLLKDAASEGKPVALGGARHSMGGQSLPRDGFAAALDAPLCVADPITKTYRVKAGARWRDVIGTLDPLGFSVAVMQSNSDFSVGGTLSVNAHGWPCPCGPFGTTVRSFRLMLADGSLVTCSRTENDALFRLAIGGYGLFGIVVDAEVEMVENVLLVPAFENVRTSPIAERLALAATAPKVSMAYARMAVDRDDFLADGLLVTYRAAEAQPKQLPPVSRSTAYSLLSRAMFRGQIGSERGKKARWKAETVLLPKLAATKPLTRNSILSYPVSVLAETSRKRTDIIQEYFLPVEYVRQFLAACYEIVPPKQDLLNVTLRYVDADPISRLAYALKPRVAIALLFSQPLTPAADDEMRAMTERIIDIVLSLEGSFYLPYRLHARPEQLRAAYPRLDEFAARKRHYDPQLRFRNLFWDRYFG